MAISANILFDCGLRILATETQSHREAHGKDKDHPLLIYSASLCLCVSVANILYPLSSSPDKRGIRHDQLLTDIDFQKEFRPPQTPAVRQVRRSRNRRPVWKAARSFARRLYKSF